jgi:hypothetical protein
LSLERPKSKLSAILLGKTATSGMNAIQRLGEDLEIAVAVAMRILSRFFAVLLIVLTASPVTAPFAACDLAALVSDGGHTAADSKSMKETTTVAEFVGASVWLEDGTVVFAFAKSTIAHSCQPAPAILRL